MNHKETSGSVESRILYTSGQYLVLNKLPGEAVEGAGSGMTDLSRLLTDRYGQEEPSGENVRPFPVTAVHRLDVPVSGCVLFVRTRAAFTSASALFSQGGDAGGVEKRYWAVVETPESFVDRDARDFPIPYPVAEKGELVHWIGRDRRRNKSAAFDTDGPGRRRGTLRYRILGQGERYFFLEIELITGRSHQIRAQLAALGLHIKGDLKYGARRSEKNGGIRLHARSLAFRNPLPEGETIRTVAPPPFRDRLWEDFEKCASREPEA